MSTHLKILNTAAFIVGDTRFLFAVNSGRKKEQHRKGGFITIHSGLAETTDPPLACTKLGSIMPGKSFGHYRASKEQAMRLIVNPGHLSSCQTRNEKLGQYGGAIRLIDFILSFSGFDELENEALMLLVSSKLKLPNKLILGASVDLKNLYDIVQKLTEATRHIHRM